MNGTIWTALGSKGSGKEQFDFTCGISYDDSTGFIYVMDKLNCRIVKTKIDSTGWTTFGKQGNGVGQFYNSGAIHYDKDSKYIYIADTGNNRIVKTMMNGSGWTTYGSEGSGKGQFKEPRGIYYDNRTEYIYVADYFNCRIVKTKINGSGWITYGTGGDGNGQFNNPTSVYYDNLSDYVYIADFRNHRIVKTKMNGSGWTTYGSEGGGTGQFRYPHGIEYDGETRYVYVAEYLNGRITKTMMNGSGWTTYGSPSENPDKGKFYYPSDITLFPSCYCCKGFLTSIPYDCGGPTNFQTISWIGETPNNTFIKFQLRTSNNESNLLNEDFIGPDGTNNTYYSTSGSAICPGHDGDRWIQYRVYLNSSDFSKTPILKDVEIQYNILPDQPILNTPENNTCINNNAPSFTWIFNDTDSISQSAFQWQMDDLINFSSINYDSNSINTTMTSFTPESTISDGSWYWRVRARDSDNDWGSYSMPWRIIIDTIAPSSKIIYPFNSQFYNRLDLISGLTLDSVNGSGIDKVELLIYRINDDSYWNGISWVDFESWLKVTGTSEWIYNSSTIPWTSGMEYLIRSRATDNASNIEIPGVGKTFVYDAEEVIYSNAYPLADEISNNTELEVGITITDTISGVNASTIEYSTSTNDGQNWTAWESIEKYENGKDINVKINLTFPNGTGNRIRWRAYDIAGNGPEYSDEYVINVNIQKPPIIPEIKLVSPLNNSKITTTSVRLSWEVINNYHPDIMFDIKMGTQHPPQEVIEYDYTDTDFNVDQLENGKTYYWTVIPKVGNITGTCFSGIWSFNVDIPLPRAILKTPENNSIITSTLPTLVWLVDYKSTETVTYDVYFGTNKDPPLKHEELSTTYFAIDTALQNNTTYYWKIVPWVGKYEGFSSEIWSFTMNIKDDKIPEFGIEFYLNPNPLEIKPGEVKFVSAIVTNLGEQKDNYTVQIGDINNSKLTAENYRQDTLEITPGKNKEFLIIISVEENTKPGFENITITAKSKLAEKYNLEIQDNQVLTIKILEKDIQKEKDRGLPISIFYFSILLLIIILIIISIIILIIVRKKTSKKESKVVESQDIISETSPESIITPEPTLELVPPMPVPVQVQQPEDIQTTQQDEQEE
jgi:hypothetical protein